MTLQTLGEILVVFDCHSDSSDGPELMEIDFCGVRSPILIGAPELRVA